MLVFVHFSALAEVATNRENEVAEFLSFNCPSVSIFFFSLLLLQLLLRRRLFSPSSVTLLAVTGHVVSPLEIDLPRGWVWTVGEGKYGNGGGGVGGGGVKEVGDGGRKEMEGDDAVHGLWIFGIQNVVAAHCKRYRINDIWFREALSTVIECDNAIYTRIHICRYIGTSYIISSQLYTYVCVHLFLWKTLRWCVHLFCLGNNVLLWFWRRVRRNCGILSSRVSLRSPSFLFQCFNRCAGLVVIIDNISCMTTLW